MEEILFDMFETAPYLVSLLAGFLTFFSPCVLPLIPAYLSYISGLSVNDLKNRDNHKNRFIILRASIMFILGFGLIFILLGAAMANLIEDVFAYPFVPYIAGGVIIIFGLHFMKVINIKLLNYEVRAEFGDTTNSNKTMFMQIITPFLLGVSFALGWTPCIGPIFAGIVSMAAQEETKGLTLMVIYTIGLAIPFILSALITSKALTFFNKVKQNFKIVEIISGGLLIIIGVAIATGGLGKISAIIMQITN